MSDIEALITKARPRKAWTETIQTPDGPIVLFFYLWPWRRERRLAVHGRLVRQEIWKPY